LANCQPTHSYRRRRRDNETGPGDYVGFEPEEIAKAVPEADKTLDVEAFVRATHRVHREFVDAETGERVGPRYTTC
jgi:non-homologous end joining protein Ku